MKCEQKEHRRYEAVTKRITKHSWGLFIKGISTTWIAQIYCSITRWKLRKKTKWIQFVSFLVSIKNHMFSQLNWFICFRFDSLFSNLFFSCLLMIFFLFFFFFPFIFLYFSLFFVIFHYFLFCPVFLIQLSLFSSVFSIYQDPTIYIHNIKIHSKYFE